MTLMSIEGGRADGRAGRSEPGAPTPSIYPIQFTRLHQTPARQYAEHRSYLWYVDVDRLPRLPRWLAPFARFEAADHFGDLPGETLRERVDNFLAAHGMALPGGRVTALLMPRVLGQSFSPLSVFWCHDASGVLRCVIAEAHGVGGQSSAYLLPPEDGPTAVLGPGRGYFLVDVPLPTDKLDLTVSLHRDGRAVMVSTWRGSRRPATRARILALQLTTPLAPHMAALSAQLQGLMLRLRGAPAVPIPRRVHGGPANGSPTAWAPNRRSWAPS